MHKLEMAMKDIDLTKSPELDGINGQMLSHLGTHARLRLLDIFNLAWNTGCLPRDWKKAIIVPIKKPGQVDGSPENYRPIALTCVTSKLMEKMVQKRLLYHLDNCNLEPKEQYGFRRGHCATDQVLDLCLRIRDA
ncbi:putative RNA-directed DNA polymerase from transposon BS [Trichonephila clavipes]|nr:putative RNA-directed DNA polymerase from transposon BS [Trichonephila clavipes]